jgi:DNA-binding MarR family transcriptional regulator
MRFVDPADWLLIYRLIYLLSHGFPYTFRALIKVVESSTLLKLKYDCPMARQNATSPRWLNAAEMKAWRRYIVASRRLLEALDLDLVQHELSMADYEILAQLSDAPERRMRMSELADVAMLSRSRLSHRMKVMEKAGWVKREACPIDKRGYFAVMTAKGWKAIVAAAPDHVESVRARFVDHLSKGDQAALAEIFERVSESLRKDLKDK